MNKRLVPNRRRSLAIATAALILLATFVIGKEDPTPETALSAPARDVQSQRKESVGAAPTYSLPRLDLEKLNRAKADEIAVNLFAPKTWVATPPVPKVPLAPAAPVLPPAPSAPALPFTYVGKLMDGDKLVVFLVRQDTKYSVSAGDIIDSSYRVEQVSEGGVVFTYLPLNIKQNLTINPPQ